MPFLAQEHFDIPTKDILSSSFDNPCYDLDKLVSSDRTQSIWWCWHFQVYIDAVKPERSISGREGRSLVCKLVAGLRNAGLKPGDCVVVASFNDVRTSVTSPGIALTRVVVLPNRRPWHYSRRWCIYRHKPRLHLSRTGSPRQNCKGQIHHIRAWIAEAYSRSWPWCAKIKCFHFRFAQSAHTRRFQIMERPFGIRRRGLVRLQDTDVILLEVLY